MMRIRRTLFAFMLCLFLALSLVETSIASQEGDATPPKMTSGKSEPRSPEKQGGVKSSVITSPGDESEYEAPKEEIIADPLESYNRLIFRFNDKFYVWLGKPVAKGYNYVVPEGVRIAVRNFFRNLNTPLRFVNAVLQGKIETACIEFARFGINSTVGLAGFFDIAKNNFHLEWRGDRDTGVTLGCYGLGPGFYIVWPFLGPSSLRDSVGMVGDFFLIPINYVSPWEDAFALQVYQYLNIYAMGVGDYEAIRESSLDLYVAIRNVYFQYRENLIKK